MNFRSAPRIAAIVVLVAAILLDSCTRTPPPAPATDVQFQVDPEQLGPAYENASLGVAFRPPVNWDQLNGEQRDAVVRSFMAAQGTGGHVLQVEDIFFDTETLSFSSIGRISGIETNEAADAYEQAFGEELGVSNDAASDYAHSVAARMEFGVNGIPITQFRYLRSNRLTFTLLFRTADDELARLDYSIPTENYQRESIKLESSIGSLSLVDDNAQ